MALADEVTNRVSSSRLIQLTNPDAKGTTIDTARLALAVADAQAFFSTYVGITYDNTLAAHVQLGVRLVLYFLREFVGEGTDFQRQRLVQDCQILARRGATAWIEPSTDGAWQPSEAPTDKPDFDRDRFDYYRGKPPGTAT